MKNNLGIIYALSAYGLWGVLPLYFVLLNDVSPYIIVSLRVIFSLIFCSILLLFVKQFKVLLNVFKSKKTFIILVFASIFIYINWQVFVIAVSSNRIVEASLGYFINPIFSVILAVVFLKEKLSIYQMLASVIATIAVIVIAVDYGSLPIISLSLAASFAMYSLLKNISGAKVNALVGLSFETIILTPLALGQIFIILTYISPGQENYTLTQIMLLAGLGPVTAIPLLFFAASAKRIPLSYLGLLQFLGPILQFIIGVYILEEYMPISRWVGFILIWISVMFIIIEQIKIIKNNTLKTVK